MSRKKRDPCFLIEMNAQQEDGKLKISPIGEFKGVDGRSYTLNGSDVVETNKNRKVDVVLNVNHGWEREGDKAAGWFSFNSLELREDGIYAELEQTDIGTELIEKKHYKYLSPEYRVARTEDNLIVLEIVGVGLVNRPNVLDDALNEQETSTEEKPNEKEDNSMANKEKDIELQAQLDAQKEENAQLKQDAKKAKIDRAVASSELMPNKVDFAMGLNGEQLESFLAINKEDAKHLSTNTKPDDKDEDDANKPTDAEVEVNRQLGLGE